MNETPPLALIARSASEQANTLLARTGTPPEALSAQYSVDEDGIFSLRWVFPSESADEDEVIIDFTDDHDEEGRAIFEHRLSDLNPPIGKDAAAIFEQFEPQFAAMRRIQFFIREYQGLSEIFSQSVHNPIE